MGKGWGQLRVKPRIEPDTTPPEVVISFPGAGADVLGTAVQVRGTASDNVGVSQVLISMDGSAYSVASGTTSWSKSYSGLSVGPHTAIVRAKDAAGNFSSEKSRVFNMRGTQTAINFPGWHGGNWSGTGAIRGSTTPLTTDEIDRRFKRMLADKMNFIRIPLYWRPFDDNPDAVITEVNRILTRADQAMQVVPSFACQLTFHQHGLTPNDPQGFPARYFSGYSTSTMYRWWQDFITNQIPGHNIWNDIYELFWRRLLDAVRNHPSLKGNEPLNEPKFTPVADRVGLRDADEIHQSYGNRYTELYDKIRGRYTDRPDWYYIICEGNQTKAADEGADGIGQAGDMARIDRFAKLFPKNRPNIAYAFHRYRLLDRTGPNAETCTPEYANIENELKDVSLITAALPTYGVQFVGTSMQEWAVGRPSGSFPGSPNTLESMRLFWRAIKAFGIGSVYWSFWSERQTDGREFYIKDSSDPTGWVPNHTREYFCHYPMERSAFPPSVTDPKKATPEQGCMCWVNASQTLGPGVFYMQARQEAFPNWPQLT